MFTIFVLKYIVQKRVKNLLTDWVQKTVNNPGFFRKTINNLSFLLFFLLKKGHLFLFFRFFLPITIYTYIYLLRKKKRKTINNLRFLETKVERCKQPPITLK